MKGLTLCVESCTAAASIWCLYLNGVFLFEHLHVDTLGGVFRIRSRDSPQFEMAQRSHHVIFLFLKKINVFICKTCEADIGF